MPVSPVFDETYESYLARIGGLDLAAMCEPLGIEAESDEAIIKCFNRTYRVSPKGIHDSSGKRPELSISVLLSKYLLMCPDKAPQAKDLVTFKDFRDAAPLIQFFRNSVQGEIEQKFNGNINRLDKACRALGGCPYRADLAYQVKFSFRGLPKIPVYLLFNDAEEGFAAQCTLLFERSAEVYLDMESLAMLGSALARWL